MAFQYTSVINSCVHVDDEILHGRKMNIVRVNGVGMQVSLLIENLVLGQSRALERAHLDPERHMQPEFLTSQPVLSYSGMPDYTGDAGELSPPAGMRLNVSAKKRS